MAKTGEKITWLTGYDYLTAKYEEKAGVDMILVGDSLGMVTLGYDTTYPVTMDEMIIHSRAVRRGAPNTFVVGDMPYMSYEVSNEEAANAVDSRRRRCATRSSSRAAARKSASAFAR